MSQNNNILQELNELNSSLAGITPGNIYTVPVGYFDGLATQVLNRIKAMEATNVAEELSYLSPLLNTISRQMPYAVPANYFENIVLPSVHQTAGEELESISPLLNSLKKEMSTRPGHSDGPYEVPAGYFENLSANIRKENEPAKVVSITHRKWFKYAAAAMITGVIALTAFLVIGKKDIDKMPYAKFEKKLNKEIQKMSDTELADFLETTEATMNGQENVSTNKNDEVQDLLKDVPESELKEFIEETSDLDTDPTMMN